MSAMALEAWRLGAVTLGLKPWCVAGWPVSRMRHRWFETIAHGTETIGQVKAYPHTSEGRILSLHSF